MEKLELKHLVGYLPYGLELWHNQWKEILIMDFAGSNCDTLSIEDVGEYAKPILRSLSDLAKEIEVNGEKFVPMNWFEKNINKTINFYKPINENYNLSIDIETEDYSQTIDLFEGYLTVQKLYEWHFDIHGLIEKGLAIDINTLNK